MVFGSDAPTVFFLIFWLGGLASIAGWLAFAHFVEAPSMPFWKTHRFPLVLGLGLPLLAGAGLALAWHFGVVSDRFMEGAPLVGLLVTAIGATAGAAASKRRREQGPPRRYFD